MTAAVVRRRAGVILSAPHLPKQESSILGALRGDAVQARRDLATAEASGDATAIARAQIRLDYCEDRVSLAKLHLA